VPEAGANSRLARARPIVGRCPAGDKADAGVPQRHNVFGQFISRAALSKPTEGLPGASVQVSTKGTVLLLDQGEQLGVWSLPTNTIPSAAH